MKFNTPKASSAPSERLFSGEKLVLETKRNHLGDENFEKLLLLNCYRTSTSTKVCLTKNKYRY